LRTRNERSGAQEADRLPSYCITFWIKVQKIIEITNIVHYKTIYLLIKNRQISTNLLHEVSYTIWWYIGFRDDGGKSKYAVSLIKNTLFCSEHFRNFYIFVLRTRIHRVNKRFEYFVRMENIQDDSQIVSITVADDFLGLSDL
jgi:hypothetical protein